MAKIKTHNKEVKIANYTKKTFSFILIFYIFLYKKISSSSMMDFPPPNATYTLKQNSNNNWMKSSMSLKLIKITTVQY